MHESTKSQLMYSDCTLQLTFRNYHLSFGEVSKKYPQLSEKAKYSYLSQQCV